MKTYSIILLSAGPSNRLGKPKQLLPFNDTTLLQHLINEAKASLAKNVLIVLGAYENEIQSSLEPGNIHIAINNEWQEGMASSIKFGINEVQKFSPVSDAAILMMCDQPYVTAALLNDLMSTHEQTGKPIVSCTYDFTIGPPALFHQSLFPELLQLTGDAGAKRIIEIHAGTTATVPFPQGVVDINTMDDFESIAQFNSRN